MNGPLRYLILKKGVISMTDGSNPAREAIKILGEEVKRSILGQAFDGTGLGEAGQSFDQYIAVGQKGDDQPFDHRTLANDRALYLLAENFDRLTCWVPFIHHRMYPFPEDAE